MKLIKIARLTFQEGNSDKVYDVDLCELLNHDEQRYLVNFRYGRHGTKLREGTKTPSPVDLKTAEALFNSVVVSKTNKGYQHQNAADQTSRSLLRSSPYNNLSDYLNQIEQQPDSTLRARMIWRLPQTTNNRLATWLTEKLQQGQWVEQYARIWTIGRTGDPSHSVKLVPYLYADNLQLRELALEAISLLDPTNKVVQTLRQQIFQHVDQSLQSAVLAENSEQILTVVRQHLATAKYDKNQLIKQLYLLAIDYPIIHQCLRTLLPEIPLQPGLFKGVRYLFKMAEFRLDLSLYALLTYQVETTKEFFSSDWGWVWLKGSGSIKAKEELVKPDSRLAYSQKTRNYFRRRSWRALKQLGLRGDNRYVELATQMLLAFNQQDIKAEKTAERYYWLQQTRNYQKKTIYYDGYATYLAFNHILRANSPNFELNSSGLLWINTGQPNSDNQRQEAFPELWDQQPDALLQLLIASSLPPVSEFAVRSLTDHSDYCQTLSDQQMIALLSASNTAIEFALTYLQQRPLNHKLLLALLKTKHPQGYALALQQLQHQQRQLFDNSELAATLLLCDDEGIQTLLTQSITQTFLGSAAQSTLIHTLFVQLIDADQPLPEHHAVWLADFLHHYLSDALRTLSLTTIEPLLTVTDMGVQLFAIRLLNHMPLSFAQLPMELLQTIHHSDFAQIRAVGLLLLGKQSQHELLLKLPFLVDLVYHGDTPEQEASLQLLEKLLPNYAAPLFNQLMPLTFKQELIPGQHERLLTFITTQLSAQCLTVDKDTIWRLLQAQSAAAQQLGDTILRCTDPRQFSMKQLVNLASNPLVSVRHFIQQFFTQHVPLIKTYQRDALRILESRWPDTQSFAFDFFKHHFTEVDWTPELIISLCDSTVPQVQTYGRELLQLFFKQEQGEEYLYKLSQHPSVTVQTFVTHFLNDYAAGKPDIILSLKSYFLTVLSQINRGRVSKDRTLTFLIQEANTSPEVLAMVTALFTRLSLTLVAKDKTQLIKAMLTLKKQHPSLELPITLHSSLQEQGVHHAS